MEYQIEDAGGGGLAGNGMGLLNGQTTKRDSILLVEEGGCLQSTQHGEWCLLGC
jgi:hypothetical protein